MECYRKKCAYTFLYKNQVSKNPRGSNSQKLLISAKSRQISIFCHPKNNSFKDFKVLKMLTRVITLRSDYVISSNDSLSLKPYAQNHFFERFNKVID